jgi:3-deoxy-D-manno-octulosonic-acid transferase
MIDQLDIDFKLIIAPHQVDNEHIEQIKKKFGKYRPVLYSNADEKNLQNSHILIIDDIGYLSYLYRYATITYIGGGFGAGIHNLLEAATYGKPVIFGPNHARFKEAIELKENGGGFAISNSEELISLCKLLFTDNKKYETSAQSAKNYVIKNAGATKKVLEKAKEFLTAK